MIGNVLPRPALASTLARRAVDLARDGRTASDDGAEHLCRLAGGHRDVLSAPLSELCDTEGRPCELECARMLLTRALRLIP
jgi:hypothetical protein